MKLRRVIIGIDDICSIFRDYASLTGFPADATCSSLFINPANRQLILRVESSTFGEHEQPEQIRFDLKRTFIV